MSEPSELPSALSDVGSKRRPAVDAWWSSLDTTTRAAVHLLYDHRRDDLRRVVGEDGWQELPIELRGRFIDPQDAVDASLWREQLIEYINAHPEVGFFLQEKEFHICRAHATARAVVRTGILPHDFECPRRERDCPFEAALLCGEGSIVLAPQLRRA